VSGVKRKRGVSQSELALMQSLMEVHAEEAAFTFCEINWEALFRGSFFKVVKGLLNVVSSIQWIREGGPDGKIISIK